MTLSFEVLPGAEFRGPITRIDPAANAKSRVFDVEVTLPNPQGQLKIGFLGALEIGEERGTGALYRHRPENGSCPNAIKLSITALVK